MELTQREEELGAGKRVAEAHGSGCADGSSTLIFQLCEPVTSFLFLFLFKKKFKKISKTSLI